jgi:hypothetical protein
VVRQAAETTAAADAVLSRLRHGWFDLDRHLEAGADALGHDAVVLEQVETAPDATGVGPGHIGTDLYPECADAEATPVVAHQ